MSIQECMAAYNAKLARYYKMEAWEREASREEQVRLEPQIRQVIEDCNDALNKVMAYQEVSSEEVHNGFAIVFTDL